MRAKIPNTRSMRRGDDTASTVDAVCSFCDELEKTCGVVICVGDLVVEALKLVGPQAAEIWIAIISPPVRERVIRVTKDVVVVLDDDVDDTAAMCSGSAGIW